MKQTCDILWPTSLLDNLFNTHAENVLYKYIFQMRSPATFWDILYSRHQNLTQDTWKSSNINFFYNFNTFLFMSNYINTYNKTKHTLQLINLLFN